jgi:anti-sigma regulatory factor (Ser/Thr protein kinase)
MAEERADEAQEWLSAIARGERSSDRGTLSARLGARTMSVYLAAVPESVKQARDFAHTALCAWDLAEMYDDVRLVVSELVTNAMRYTAGLVDGRTGGEAGADSVGELPIRLSLLVGDGRLTCAVTDPSDQIPVHREPDFASQHGRGLHLVEAFSDSWDWVPLAGRGKVVWACFRCPV